MVVGSFGLIAAHVNIEDFRAYCLAKKGVTESMPFGNTALVFKVLNKMFALAEIDSQPLSVNLKCDPERAGALREMYPCVQPGYHMNKKHWNTVTADGSVNLSLLREWIDHSYDLVAHSLTKAQQQELAQL